MKKLKNLQIAQLDAKTQGLPFSERPARGWVNAIRVSLNMSLQQLGSKIGISRQSVLELENSERSGTVSLNTLNKVASALNMKLVYGFLPNDGSFEKMIERKALTTAREIVMRTNTTMKLEDQQVSKERLEKAVKELAAQIKEQMPKYLWD